MRRALDAIRTGVALVAVVGSLAAWALVGKR
jgi:hypothetical protein